MRWCAGPAPRRRRRRAGPHLAPASPGGGGVGRVGTARGRPARWWRRRRPCATRSARARPSRWMPGPAPTLGSWPGWLGRSPPRGCSLPLASRSSTWRTYRTRRMRSHHRGGTTNLTDQLLSSIDRLLDRDDRKCAVTMIDAGVLAEHPRREASWTKY